MANWLESQIDARQRLDAKALEQSYSKLASSVSDLHVQEYIDTSSFEEQDRAIALCLNYIGVRPGTVPPDVTDMNSRLEWLCRPSGTMYRDVRLQGAWYKDAIGAMLGYLDTGQPIALLPYTFGGYYFEDPESGRNVRVTAKVSEHIKIDGVIFYCPLPQGELGTADLLRFIVRVFDRSDYFFICAITLATTLVGLLPAWANQLAFGTVAPSGQENLIAPIGALLFGVSVSSLLLGISKNLITGRVNTKLTIATEAAVFSRVLMLPTSFFKEYESGSLANRVEQVTALVQMITSIAFGTLLTCVFSLVYVGQIGAYAPMLVIPALFITLLEVSLTSVVTIISARRQRVAMEASAGLSGLVTALLNGIQKIKLAGAEDRAFSKWAEQYAKYARAEYNPTVIERALPAVITSIGLLGTIVIYALAGGARLPVADYMAFNVAYGQINGAMMGLAGVAVQAAQIPPMMKMVEAILKACPETDEDKPSVERLTGSIEMSGVTFRYDEDSPNVLDGLSLKINSGEYVAIVGKSGCGKSTIMRLLLGFEKPQRGSIFYGPYDVSRVNLRSLRQSIGMVMQDGKLFMGDIFSNIIIASPGATLDDAWRAAEIAGIADDIRKMPMGMQTMLTEGSGGISGGQRQRIMIARAVCGERRILMLDEATSALDNVTQKHVSDSLETLKCTRVVVAHRLSTVRHCDRILVVDGGRIAEEGTYDELIAKNGLFAELVARQRLE